LKEGGLMRGEEGEDTEEEFFRGIKAEGVIHV
jgi:hypothetical protein